MVNDITGMKFGKLTVIKRHPQNYISPSGKYQLAQWECVCDCQLNLPENERKIIVVTGSNLRKGNTTSCGCYAHEVYVENGKKVGALHYKRQIKSVNTFGFEDDYAFGIDSNGNKFIFDICDYERVSKYSWLKDDAGYIKTSISNKKVALARFILDINDEDLVVDHKNHNLLDNRRSNLRIATMQQNSRNRKLSKNNTSGYTGVSFDNTKNKWIAYVVINNKMIYLGAYDDIMDAVNARVEAENIYYKEFSYNNSINNYE